MCFWPSHGLHTYVCTRPISTYIKITWHLHGLFMLLFSKVRRHQELNLARVVGTGRSTTKGLQKGWGKIVFRGIGNWTMPAPLPPTSYSIDVRALITAIHSRSLHVSNSCRQMNLVYQTSCSLVLHISTSNEHTMERTCRRKVPNWLGYLVQLKDKPSDWIRLEAKYSVKIHSDRTRAKTMNYHRILL